MRDKKPDNKADKDTAVDRGEAVTLMEPLMVQNGARQREELADLALQLTARSTALRSSLPEGIVAALSHLVRSMNCYYSNLIEGHDTHPIDIERALNEDFSHDPQQRDLQLEACAHINVQQWIDEGGLSDKATSTDSVLEMHRRFCAALPEDLLWVENPDSGERIKIEPGKPRTRDVKVGRHVAISAGSLPRFMTRFESAYARLGNVDAIAASAAAHHRLLWMHPFLDGNGRVARLMSYAMLREALDTGGIWSVARGLARNVETYKAHLANCDLSRRNDLDGRGNLSEEALAEFAKFFITTCIDQINFMDELIQPNTLRSRILNWAEDEIRTNTMPPKSDKVLEAVLYRGELPRGDVSALLNVGDRSARRVTSALLQSGVLNSTSTRAPLNLAFPATLASRWMPGLFPDKQ